MLPLLDMMSSALLKGSKRVKSLRGRTRRATEDSRGRDDLVSGPPDEQDWSLVSGGREERSAVISGSLGFRTDSG